MEKHQSAAEHPGGPFDVPSRSFKCYFDTRHSNFSTSSLCLITSFISQCPCTAIDSDTAKVKTTNEGAVSGSSHMSNSRMNLHITDSSKFEGRPQCRYNGQEIQGSNGPDYCATSKVKIKDKLMDQYGRNDYTRPAQRSFFAFCYGPFNAQLRSFETPFTVLLGSS